jgi:hypothetical protein
MTGTDGLEAITNSGETGLPLREEPEIEPETTAVDEKPNW